MAIGERAFYMLDGDLRLITASPNTLSIWGRAAKEVRGKSLLDLFPHVDGGPVHEALQQALRSFRPVRLRTHSVLLGKEVELEIYPVREGLQVSFAPVAQ